MICVRRRALATSGTSWIAAVHGLFSTLRKRELLSFMSNLGEVTQGVEFFYRLWVASRMHLYTCSQHRVFTILLAYTIM